ncbi:adenylate/guanylate cyclase domain-containing protein [soil metagenome]
MIRISIRRQILGIAVGLIVLMVITSVLSMFMAGRVGVLLNELTTKYIPAYGHLSRMNINTLERAMSLRRMAIAKMQFPMDETAYAERLKVFDAKGLETEREAQAARKLINAIIDDPNTVSDDAALGRIESRIDIAITSFRSQLDDERAQLLVQLDARNFEDARQTLDRVDAIRDELNSKVDAIRADMLNQVYFSGAATMRNQKRTILISAVVTALAGIIGLIFALLVSGGITRPVKRLLEGTREIEAGRLDGAIDVTTRDEIGQLSAAFNRMVETLRHNERIRETFGRYIDPKVVEGLIDQPAVAAANGQRRVMTVLFCDMKGFTRLSEGVTPQGLVKIMNHYLSTMSAPVRGHRGIIDKYIGDMIMAYWGPPFVEDSDQAALACLAALDMIGRIPSLRKELPELLGMRAIPVQCDIRIGVATGEALVGSIGSELMMSYTVMGDTVNLASRLESANKLYSSRLLASETTIAQAGIAIEVREIDRLVVLGQSRSQAVYEIMARKGGLTPDQAMLRTRYAEGLAAYRTQDWDAARRAFHAALEAVPGDGPSTTLLARIDNLAAVPPAADWDGAWHLDHK